MSVLLSVFHLKTPSGSEIYVYSVQRQQLVNKDLEGSSRDPVSDNTSVPAFACRQSRKSPEPKHSRCLGPKPAKTGPQYTSFNKQGDK